MTAIRFALSLVMLYPLCALVSAQAADFDHNGSAMEVDYDGGAITYRVVKPSLRGFVQPGFVAFTGTIEERGAITGTAFTFRRNCEPAPYSVSGRYDPTLPGYVLRGAAPVRDGCRVSGYTLDSPNARLEFVDLDPGPQEADEDRPEIGPQPNETGPQPQR